MFHIPIISRIGYKGGNILTRRRRSRRVASNGFWMHYEDCLYVRTRVLLLAL